MLRNYNGFTFVEVMFALAILTLTTASLGPLFIMTINERLTVKEQFTAYELLHNTMEEIRATSSAELQTKTIEENETIYYMTVGKQEEMITVCINWNGRNGRTYEECGVFIHE